MQQNNNTKYIHIIKGGLAGVVSLAAVIGISAFIIYKSNLSENLYIPFMVAAVILSGVISGYISTMKIRKSGMMNGAITSIPLVIVLLVAMSVANRGFSVYMMIPCIITVLSAAAGGIVAVNIKRKNKKK